MSMFEKRQRIKRESTVNNLLRKLGLTTETLPDGVVKFWRSGFWIVIHYSGNAVKIEIPKSATPISQQAYWFGKIS